MARKKQIKSVEISAKNKLIVDQAAALADFAATAYVAAGEMEIKTKPVSPFPLEEVERATLALIPTLPLNVKKKMAKKDAPVTVTDVASMVTAISDVLLDVEPNNRAALLKVAQKLMGCLQENLVPPKLAAKTTTAKKAKANDAIYQFKITLKDSRPPIWRRIQIKDCTLAKLHEHIQAAMGWRNSHLHHFVFGEQFYGDPKLMQENFEEMEYKNSTTTKISAILPNTPPFSFAYEYDFGDSWDHKIVFEGMKEFDSNGEYPRCTAGARACPPEDCGGTWGYSDLLAAIGDENHEQHMELRNWVGSAFDPEAFDPIAATKAMKKGAD